MGRGVYPLYAARVNGLSAGLLGYDFDNNRRRHMKRAKFGEIIRIVTRRSAQRLAGAAMALLPLMGNAVAGSTPAPYGISARVAPPPYLRMPHLAGGKIPALLSQTGAFSDTRNLVPARGLIPYDLVVAFWSDGAIKTRWVDV